MKDKKSPYSVKELVILAILVGVPSFAAIGFTRANLEVAGGEYTVQISMGQIGVALLENDRLVSCSGGNGEVSVQGRILEDLLDSDEKTIAPGKSYNEILSVKNVGSIDEYIRVILVKRWVDKNGIPLAKLSPQMIQLNLLVDESSDWIIDPSASTRERTVLYYKKILAVNKAAVFADSLTISEEILHAVKITESNGIVTVTYDYDGALFELDIEVNGVQTHNGKDAILSAWGVSVSLNEEGDLSLDEGGAENENLE